MNKRISTDVKILRRRLKLLKVLVYNNSKILPPEKLHRIVEVMEECELLGEGIDADIIHELNSEWRQVFLN